MKLSFFISISWLKNFLSKKKKTDTSNQIDTTFSFYLGYLKALIHLCILMVCFSYST